MHEKLSANVRLAPKLYKRTKQFVKSHRLEFPSITNFVNIAVLEKLDSYRSAIARLEKIVGKI